MARKEIDNRKDYQKEGKCEECTMSLELFQNARMTMGELRDLAREGGFSWEFLQRQIEDAQRSPSTLDKIHAKMDDYSTGPGRSLHDKSSNFF